MAGLRLSGALGGAKEVQRELKKLAKAAPSALARALYQQGFEVQAAAVRKAPVKDGVLRSSAYVAPPQEEGGALSVEVGFGTVYAAVQHEREDFEHPRGGEAKYLEKAVAEKASLAQLAALARSNLEKGLGLEALPKLAPARPPSTSSLRKRVQRKQERKSARKMRRDLKRQQKRRKTRGRKRRKR
jgi:hemolysin activation/secretion protein